LINGAPLENINVPPGHVYKPWMIEELDIQKEKEKIELERIGLKTQQRINPGLRFKTMVDFQNVLAIEAQDQYPIPLHVSPISRD
jgi:hypothetical protein